MKASHYRINIWLQLRTGQSCVQPPDEAFAGADIAMQADAVARTSAHRQELGQFLRVRLGGRDQAVFCLLLRAGSQAGGGAGGLAPTDGSLARRPEPCDDVEAGEILLKTRDCSSGQSVHS